LAETLRGNLARCAENPEVDPVHDTRTGTRRLQAILENVVRATPEDAAGLAVRDYALAVTRQLKKIRRAAGPVRDLDVHRKLLEKLTERALGIGTKAAGEAVGADPEEGGAGTDSDAAFTPDVLETRAAGYRASGLGEQAGRLDAWLRHQRNEQAQGLKKAAAGFGAKFEKRLAALEEALRAYRGRKRAPPPAVLALDGFARLATEMQLLDAGNLHDFRKGAKKARYVAELAAQGDLRAGAVGKALKKLQDEIGDWHDWLVLAEEAQAALGDEAPELAALVEAERERHYVAAMKMVAKLRGRLMGEWLAGEKQRKSGQRRSGQRKSGQLEKRSVEERPA
jgi:CHAD domain-containing protein